MLDKTDKKILSILQEDASTSNVEIARQLNMAPSGTLERIRKLKERGVIEGYTVRLNPKRLGYGLTAFMFVKSSDRVGEIKNAKLLSAIPEVLELHHIAGEDCYLLKLCAQDTDHLAQILRDKIGPIKSVMSTKTTIVFETVKTGGVFPLIESQESD